MKKLAKKVIPSKFHWKINNWVNTHLFGWRSRFYSCFGEDTILNGLFDNKRNGFYIDIGAFHPDKYSNTKFLYKNRGWTGINVEPNPYNFKLFKKRRRRDINLNLGVSGEETHLKYYIFDDGLYNTFSESMKDDCEANGHVCIETKEIGVKPLSRIIEEHLPQGKRIDLIDVDVEEFDLEVLKSNDWSRFRPKVVLVEDHLFSFDTPLSSPICSYLSELGYQLHSVCEYSLIFKDGPQ